MSFIIIIAGIPGSGKSTLLEEAVKIFPGLHVINYGDIMLKEASLQNIDKDHLRKLPLRDQQRIGVEAAKKMTAEIHPITCIDTHAMIKTPIGYCPGVPEEVIRILKPNMIGMIECSASIIYERRKLDKTRKRDMESIEQLDYHQQISRSFLLSCVAVSGALYLPIHNEGVSSDAAAQLITSIQSYKNG